MAAIQRSVDGSSIYLPNGEEINFASSADAERAIALMNMAMNGQMQGRQPGGGGATMLRAAADGGEAVYSLITYSRVKDAIEQVRDDRRRLRTRQEELMNTIPSGTSALPSDFGSRLQAVFRAQRDVDQSQNEALALIQQAELVHAIGGAARVASDFITPSALRELVGGDGGGLGVAGTLVVGGAAGLLVAKLFDDGDDDRDGGRRRRR